MIYPRLTEHAGPELPVLVKFQSILNDGPVVFGV